MEIRTTIDTQGQEKYRIYYFVIWIEWAIKKKININL